MKAYWREIAVAVLTAVILATVFGTITIRDTVIANSRWIEDMMKPDAILPGGTPKGELILQHDLLKSEIQAADTALRIDLEQTKVRLSNLESR